MRGIDIVFLFGIIVISIFVSVMDFVPTTEYRSFKVIFQSDPS